MNEKSTIRAHGTVDVDQDRSPGKMNEESRGERSVPVKAQQPGKGSAIQRWGFHSTGWLVCLLAAVVVVVLRDVRLGEFSYNVDETQHAVTGLYFADLIRDHPFAHPVAYTYRYYAQYPALGGVAHWPPLFYCFEALSFFFLGPTVVAARMVILFFAVVGLTFWFLLVRELLNQWAAAFSALLLGLLPSVLLFERTVMLEVPLLACCIAASYFWISYLLKDKKSDVYWFALFASAALLTKQNGVYLIPFCLLSGLLCKGWRMFLRKEVLYVVAACFVLTAPFYALAYVVNWGAVAMDLTEKNAGDSGWLFYLRALPAQLGWSLLVLALLGMVTSRTWARPDVIKIMLSWIVACYVTLTLIGHKEARYIIYWLPPFLFFAAGLLFFFFRKPWLRVTAAVSATLVIGTTLAAAWSFHRPYVTGFADVAKRIAQDGKPAVILFDGPLAGNFIFFTRADDPQRRFVVLRKALYTYRIKKRGGAVELVHSPQEINDLIREDGVRFIVVSDQNSVDFESQKMLRDLLKTPAYKELGRFPIGGDDLYPPVTSLLLYENLNWAPPTAKELRIKMLTTGHDIVIPWDSLGASHGK